MHRQQTVITHYLNFIAYRNNFTSYQNEINMKEFEGMTNESLALLYIGGNNKAFDELLARTQSSLFTYIMFVVRNEDVREQA